MMFTLHIVSSQVLEFVHSTKTNPNMMSEARAGFIHGAAGASEFERWTTGHAGFAEDAYNPKHWLLGGSLIMILFSISVVLIFLMRRWRWKTADADVKENSKAEPKTAYSSFQLTFDLVDDIEKWKISDPFLSTTKRPNDDHVIVSIPAALADFESLNQFPSSLASSLYTGFTTGVGPRR